MEREPGSSATAQFMSVAAHDLRNPIAVVRASAQMAQRQLNRGDMSAAQVRLKAIVEQTDRVTEMLETFVDAARLGAGDLPLRRERLDLHDVIATAHEHASALIADQLERSLEADIPDGCIGVWDRARVVRAVRALLGNALMYGDPQQPVRVKAARDGERVRVVISGGGRGPVPDEVPHLFECFYRGPTAADAGQAGSGLGLFVARGIARAHGGDVRRLEGDRFEIELPLATSLA